MVSEQFRQVRVVASSYVRFVIRDDEALRAGEGVPRLDDDACEDIGRACLFPLSGGGDPGHKKSQEKQDGHQEESFLQADQLGQSSR